VSKDELIVNQTEKITAQAQKIETLKHENNTQVAINFQIIYPKEKSSSSQMKILLVW